MALIKDGKAADDTWRTLDDNAKIPSEGAVIISLKRWIEEKPWLKGRNAPLGIVLSSDQPPAIIDNDLERFEIVALDFPAFKDGRAYSYARLLRERYGYEGEIRAVGDVLYDQLLFMRRCGFDSFEISDDAPLEDWLNAFDEISLVYQPATDERKTVLQARHNS